MTTPLASEPFGQLPDRGPATLFTLQNADLRVRITDYGGRMVSIEAPDRDGHRGHVLLGFADVAAYHQYGGSFGTLLGRYANRIAGAAIKLDGHTYPLSKNSGGDMLHGGAAGFNRVVWSVLTAEAELVPTLVLTHVSPDGDQGFPGELTARAVYQLEADTLTLTLEARTTKPTVINLSAHPYFNLAGTNSGDVLGHELSIAADGFLPTDAAQIPTGEIRPVAGTPFDFRLPVQVGSRIRQPDPQLFHGLGYDHCFALRTQSPGILKSALRVRDPLTGRVLEIDTDQPGVQVYTGNKLTGAFAGHEGMVYRQSAGLALEAQDFPDAPHHPNFPSTLLRPGDIYLRTIRYRFTIG
ncbi:aldose epimerase family protein [Rhodopila sp.]|uniref:aldose epimerase family protein n=1 Tax=Rhodopila sp. TaxID=2480087 RepID=UPI003D0D04AB